ncbi:hypothetical protein KDL44_09565 [bacterium]|nr:hypothetical protein [bacterium]
MERMNTLKLSALALLLLLLVSTAVPAQDGIDTEADPPKIPTLEEVQTGKAAIAQFIPMDFGFQIGVIGTFVKEVSTETGSVNQVKSPLILINPANGGIGVYAKNFPARIVANSINGDWVVGIAPSSAVPGSSGSSYREAAVSLNMKEGDLNLISEFPLHSNFQAVFDRQDENVVYYCVNEPAQVNQIYGLNLKKDEQGRIPAEGNRFNLYGLRPEKDPFMWINDPQSTRDYPVLTLLNMRDGKTGRSVEFPGAERVLVSPDGDHVLVEVSSGAESSVGYYAFEDQSFHQVPSLVMVKPEFKWLDTEDSLQVVARESTSTEDRFRLVNLSTGESRVLFSARFKVGFWDISPENDALVFVTESDNDPILFVVPLDPNEKTINRIQLSGVSDITWLGCLSTPPRKSGGGWLDNLLPF